MQGEWRGDFTRDTFDPLKHFSRVLMQQGRVQLDADWNEQVAILLRYLRTAVADFHGPFGPPPYNPGFTITPVPDQGDFFIGGGHYYVAGILCEAGSTAVPITKLGDKQVQVPGWAIENQEFQQGRYVEVFDAATPTTPTPKPAKISHVDSTDPSELTLDQDLSAFASTDLRMRRISTYLTQLDYHVPPLEELQPGKSYQVYLDVWERFITRVQDDSIREVALGGPDTAARAKVVWQVKTMAIGETTPIEHRGRLKAMAKQKSDSTDPCIIPPDARYWGAENRLYRVEIHGKGKAWRAESGPLKTNAATFKWSRDNGSLSFPIVSPIERGGETTAVILENLGRDDRLSLSECDWVEIEDDDSVLQLQTAVGNLLQVQSIDRTSMTVTLNGTPDPSVGQDLSKHPLLRRWDHKQGERNEGGLQLSDGAALIIEGQWLSLENGIQIWFQKPDQDEPPQYRPGDYWLIAARTTTGDLEWPTTIDEQGKKIPLSLPPDGIEHHYAPLAVVTTDVGGTMTCVNCPGTVLAPGSITASDRHPELPTGWVTSAFRPHALENKPDGANAIPPAFRVGATEALTPDPRGAGGTMAIPVPPGVKKVTGFKIAGAQNEKNIFLKLYLGGWDSQKQAHINKVVVDATIASGAFEETYKITDTNIDEYHTLSLWLWATGTASVSLVACQYQ